MNLISREINLMWISLSVSQTLAGCLARPGLVSINHICYVQTIPPFDYNPHTALRWRPGYWKKPPVSAKGKQAFILTRTQPRRCNLRSWWSEPTRNIAPFISDPTYLDTWSSRVRWQYCAAIGNNLTPLISNCPDNGVQRVFDSQKSRLASLVCMHTLSELMIFLIDVIWTF